MRNRSKRTIYASSELELLQMISEPSFKRCANEDDGAKGGGL